MKILDNKFPIWMKLCQKIPSIWDKISLKIFPIGIQYQKLNPSRRYENFRVEIPDRDEISENKLAIWMNIIIECPR